MDTDGKLTFTEDATFAGGVTYAGTLTSTGSTTVPAYFRSTANVSYIQLQNSSTGTNGTNDGLTIGVNGTSAYVWNREQANLYLGTNDTTALLINSSQNSTFSGTVTATHFYGDGSNLTNISAAAPSNMVTTDTSQTISGAKTFSHTDGVKIQRASNTGNAIRLYTENDGSQIADDFSANTSKSYMYFDARSSSNDPGYIMHETSANSTSEANKGVLHLVPSDDNSTGDYVSICLLDTSPSPRDGLLSRMPSSA